MDPFANLLSVIHLSPMDYGASQIFCALRTNGNLGGRGSDRICDRVSATHRKFDFIANGRDFLDTPYRGGREVDTSRGGYRVSTSNIHISGDDPFSSFDFSQDMCTILFKRCITKKNISVFSTI